MNLKKTVISIALLSAISATPVQSAVLTFDWNGNFTMLYPDGDWSSAGNFLVNDDALAAEVAASNAGEPYNYYAGNRTPITGTMMFDTDTGNGSATIEGFDFFTGGIAVPHDITFQSIGDGFGSAGSLLLTSMLLDWSSASEHFIQLVWDGAGLFAALPAMQQGDTVNQLSCAEVGSGCVVAGSDGVLYSGSQSDPAYFPMGAIPVATTTYNVNEAGTGIGGGTYLGIQGTAVYAADDNIAGSPMDSSSLPGFNASFDMTSVTLTSAGISNVPVPAAIWLFGSGLIALSGFSRRRVVMDDAQ